MSLFENLHDIVTPGVQLNQSFGNNNKTAATLWLIPPKQVPNQFRRPARYRFNGAFQHDLMNNVEQTSLPGHYSFMNSFMFDSDAAKSAILPSDRAAEINLSSFSNCWTFVLIVDNDPRMSPVQIVNAVPSRMIYSGWVIDEPVATIGANKTYNFSCIFNTTHHITLSALEAYDKTGLRRRVDTTGDYNYISPSVAQMTTTTGEQLMNLQPDKVLSSITEDPISQTGFGISSGSAILTPNPGAKSVEIPAELNAPAYHLHRIVDGLSEATKLNSAFGEEDAAGWIQPDVDIGFNTRSVDERSLHGALTTTLAPGRNAEFNTSLNPSQPFTFGELNAIFGKSLTIVDNLKRPSTIDYNLRANSGNMRRDVMTALVSDSIPPMLSKFNLGEIGFRYNSYLDRKSSGTYNQSYIRTNSSAWQLTQISGLYQCTPNELEAAYSRFQTSIFNTLFKTLICGGDFDLMVHCSLGGTCLVNLNYLDEINSYHGEQNSFVETNNLLGGLNSSLIGSTDDLVNNAGQFSTIMTTIADLNRSTNQGYDGPAVSPNPQSSTKTSLFE